MSDLSNFVVVGAGNIGGHIVTELLNKGKKVSILSREGSDNSKTSALESKGAKIIKADYDDASTLQKAFESVSAEVVILALGGAALAPGGPSNRLADGAKAASVKIFVPTDYGIDLERFKAEDIHPLISGKEPLHRYLESIQLPWTAFATGIFGSYLPLFLPNLPFTQGIKFSSTAEEDIGLAVASAFSTLPSKELHNRNIKISSFDTDFKQIVEQVGLSEDKAKVVPSESFLEASKVPDQNGFFAWLAYQLGGTGNAHHKNDNELIGFKPRHTSPVEFFQGK
ncbi:NAD(P)-binding protein [Ceraceosorus guamensis]|uniref:NAD(P)-binding protein n=1 Tax=Ceraceosorus guamensis TaxID=1522189 RepID=A0A316W036_9BASI|nr:NAD(P)-binding protein [Ceraceosorus guamensis]PWN43277.1 NAD(P)-binding protein [Ceraceosorus guamensis]